VVSTRPTPPPHPDDDPTGVRELLAGLGDPGPMPASLVDRINASIAAEQTGRTGERETVVPLRRGGPTWLRVGLAAAAVAAIAVAVPSLLGSGPGDVMASLTGGASSDSAAGGAARLGAAPSAPEAAGGRAASAGAAVRWVATGTAYTSAGLATKARGILDAPSGSTVATASPDTDEPAHTDTGLRGCLTALGVPGWMPVTADLATYDGRAAVVAVVSGDTGQSVYAVPTTCDGAHPQVLAGPVALP
jgi:hypothetical protein